MTMKTMTPLEKAAQAAANEALRGIELSAAEARDVATKAAVRAFGTIPTCPKLLKPAPIPKQF